MEDQPTGEKLELSPLESATLKTINDIHHSKRRKDLRITSPTVNIPFIFREIRDENRKDTLASSHILKPDDLLHVQEVNTPEGFRALIVNENQALVSELDDKTAIATVDLYSCTAYGLKLTPKTNSQAQYRGLGHFQMINHTEIFHQFLTQVNSKFNIGGIVFITPHFGGKSNVKISDTYQRKWIREQILAQGWKEPDDTKSLTFPDQANTGMIITNSNVLYLGAVNNDEIDVEYKVLAKYNW